MRSSLAPRQSLPTMPTWPLPLAGGALADRRLLSWRNTAGRRPNLLMEGPRDVFPTAIRDLCAGSDGPLRYCGLPGKLDLPSTPVGTLLLHDVAAATKGQQVALFDWLSTRAGDIQVISMTSASLQSMVADGLFLEGLYYRLNVIRLDLKSGTLAGAAPDWQAKPTHVI